MRTFASVIAVAFVAACGGTVDGGSHAGSSSGAGSSSSHVSPTPGSSSSPSMGLPDGGCRSTSDCTTNGELGVGALCIGPISQESTCIALMDLCANDSDCTQGYVCSTGAGAQPSGDGPLGSLTPACRPPCMTNEDCNYWESCQAGGHCQPLPCSACASYLACTAGACGPKSCATDTDCPGGYCVDMTCYASLGACEGACG